MKKELGYSKVLEWVRQNGHPETHRVLLWKGYVGNVYGDYYNFLDINNNRLALLAVKDVDEVVYSSKSQVDLRCKDDVDTSIDDNEERIMRNLLHHRWSTRWGSETPEDYGARAPIQSNIKPLLVISFKDNLSAKQIHRVNEVLSGSVRLSGWTGLVVDAMDEAKVQAFGVDAPLLSELSLDSVIELLEGLKRVKEAQV